MNGHRNPSLPSGLVQAPNNNMLANPAFIQNSAHLGQPQPIAVPQNISPANPPMGMLSGGPQSNASPRYPMSNNPMPQHQPPQQRSVLLRQGPNNPQLTSSGPNPSASHMQAQLQSMQFPGTMMQQGPPGGPPNVVRRVQSQPQMNPMGGMPNPVGGGMDIQMALNPHAPHIRHAQATAQQQHQLRIQQQQQALLQANAMRNQGPNQGMPPNMARTASAQNPVMNSLVGQPSSLSPMSHPGGIQPPHQNHSFPNGGPIPSQHPPQLSSSPGPPQTHTPNLTMATPGPSHTPVNRQRMTPDNSNTSFMGYAGTQFSGNNTARAPPNSNSTGYPFVPSSSTPTPIPMDISHSSPPSTLHSQGGTSSRSSFMATPAQPFDLMNSNQGMDIYPSSFNMGPPSSVPPRPPSHATNPHQPHQSQSNPQQSATHQPPQTPQQQQSHHQSPPQGEQMNVHPQRPQSQPQQLIPGRPPSQAGSTRTPRSMQLPLPPAGLVGSGSLTATGRLPSAQHVAGPPGPSMMPPITPRPPLAMGGVPPPPNTTSQMSVDAPQSGIPPIQRPPMVPPPASINLGQGIVRLLQFSGVLSSETKTKFQLAWWSDLVKDYFTPKAELRLTLWKDNARNEAKPFQIGVPIMPRFFLVTTQSGVKSMSFTLDGARERPHQQGPPSAQHTMIECVSAVWTFRYTNGYTVHLRGPLTASVVVTTVTPPGNSQAPQYSLKFEELSFDANMHDKFIALDSILGNRTIETPKFHNVPAPSSGSSLQAQQQIEEDRRWEEPRLLINHASIPGEPVNAFGIPQATMRCLELAESVAAMGDLIVYTNETNLGPIDALKQFANKIREQSAAGGQHSQFMNSLLVNSSTITSSNTALSNPFPPYQPPMAQPVTLYSSAPPSVTNPPNMSSSMSSPQNTSSSSANSPEKQLKTIPQQQQAPTPSQSGPASSPAVSSTGTTNNTPALANATPKRKLGEASSPTTTNNTEQPPPTKRNPRKRNRTNTTSGAG